MTVVNNGFSPGRNTV